jgi:hypothetical protein
MPISAWTPSKVPAADPIVKEILSLSASFHRNMPIDRNGHAEACSPKMCTEKSLTAGYI